MYKNHNFKIFLILMFSVVSLEFNAQIIRFKNIVGDSVVGNSLNSIDTTNDGGYVLGGTRGSSGSANSYVIKTDKEGKVEWKKVYYGFGGDNILIDIIQTHDGGYIYTGWAKNVSITSDLQLVRLDSTGNVIWSYTYNTNWNAGGVHILEDANSFFVVGQLHYDMVALRVDYSGNLLWSSLISSGAGYSSGCKTIKTIDNNYMVVSQFNDQAPTALYMFALYDINGNILSNFTFNDTTIHDELAVSIYQMANGDYIVPGFNSSAVGKDILRLFKMDRFGNIIWSKKYVCTDYFIGQSHASIDANGNTIFAGMARDTINYELKGYILKLDSSGAVLASNAITDSIQTWFTDAIPSKGNGYAFAAGLKSNSYPYYNSMIIKTDSILNMGCNSDEINFYETDVPLHWLWGGTIGQGINKYSFPVYPTSLDTTFIQICFEKIETPIRQDTTYSGFYIPNAFTPNGDGLNDVFFPINVPGNDYHLMIFDRWGELLFESYDSSAGWDGSYAGQKCSTGVYIWSINYRDLSNGELINRIGHLLIL